MKKLILFICVCTLFSCKKEKDDASDDITAYNWVLTTQVVSPAITINGKTSTDYLSLQNPEGCSKNFTYTFYNTGIFSVSSNGALCDMAPNSSSQKWNLTGDDIILQYNNVISPSSPLKVKGNVLIQKVNMTTNGVTYSLTSTYKAQIIK